MRRLVEFINKLFNDVRKCDMDKCDEPILVATRSKAWGCGL
jgi:hypothetical protein